MFDFNPFITNDGSVGLYSKVDSDIYHSVYGALSESYEKFIYPANLEYFFNKDGNLSFLDICYGIGYNTKSLMQYILNNFISKSGKNNSIDTDNEFLEKEKEKICINNSVYNKSIYTDKKDGENKEEYFINYNNSIYTDNEHLIMKKENVDNTACINSIDTDNGLMIKKIKSINNTVYSNSIDVDNKCAKITIDSVDLNKNLIMLSPFIKNNFNYKNILNIEIKEAIKAKSKTIPKKINKENIISDEINYLLIDKLINTKFVDYNFIDKYINDKKYSQYFSKKYKAYYKVLKHKNNINIQNNDLMSFVHNIYYRHVSNRLINGSKTNYNNIFDVNLIYDDAINFLLSSNKKYNVVFLDAFTPAKCPKLWTKEFFNLISKHLYDDSLILTYSNSAQIRNALINSGFYIGKNFSEKNNKSYGTIASKNKLMIKYFLSEYETGLLNTKAGIFYKDPDFKLSDESIIKNYKEEFNNSTLISSSKYKKFFKNEYKNQNRYFTN